MKNCIKVTIDGPSASGKSTVAKKLAKKLSYMHLDTGAIYRAIALYFKELNILDALYRL
jgi:cytidylate kinase